MVTAVIAQPDDAIESVGDAPSRAPPHAGSCCRMIGMLIELSAEAVTWLAGVDATEIAPASAAARRRRVGLGNLTDGKPQWDGRTNAAPLDARLRRKQQ